jgi:8-oxo-dGTP diphosphatase
MRTFAWNYCPICSSELEPVNDGERVVPFCADCERFYYRNPVPAACCFVVRDDKLLFVQRSIEPCKGMWSFPGGFVELGESSEEAALRELNEETGLVGTKLRLIGANTQQSPYAGAVLVLGYLVEEWSGEPVAATDAMAAGFFERNQRPELAFQVHKELLLLFDGLGRGY